MKLIIENKIKKIECDPAPDGTIDILEKKFVDKQVKEYQYTVDIFTQRIKDSNILLGTLTEDSDLYNDTVKNLESLERNLEKCIIKLKEYSDMNNLLK